MKEGPTINGKPCTMGELREFVFHRDGYRCMAIKLDPFHRCSGKWAGVYQHPEDLTLEHVPTVHGPADVRRHNERHCVTLCYGLNVGAPSHELREQLRERLRSMYPACFPPLLTTLAP